MDAWWHEVWVMLALAIFSVMPAVVRLVDKDRNP
jgi:hypothetical protein